MIFQILDPLLQVNVFFLVFMSAYCIFPPQKMSSLPSFLIIIFSTLFNYDNSPFVCNNIGGIESLLTKLEAYTPVVSDATTKSILQHVGVNTDDPQVTVQFTNNTLGCFTTRSSK